MEYQYDGDVVSPLKRANVENELLFGIPGVAQWRFSNFENLEFVASAGTKNDPERFSKVCFNVLKEVSMPLIEVKIVLINSPVFVVSAGDWGEKRD